MTLNTPFVTIVGLYSNVPGGDEIRKDQFDWFVYELKTLPKDRALIVTVHHPPFSADEERCGSDIMRQLLDKALIKAVGAQTLSSQDMSITTRVAQRS